MTYALFRRCVHKIHSSISLACSGYSRKNDDDSLPLESHVSKTARRGKLRSVNPLPTTFYDGDLGQGSDEWNSKDRIVARGYDVGEEEQDLKTDAHAVVTALPGIMVTKETNIRRDNPNPARLEGHAHGVWETGVSESSKGSFKYRETDGLKYTVYAERA
jgi:hypothetical protein